MNRWLVTPVAVWAAAHPDQISKRFINLIVHDPDLDHRLGRLFELFAVPAPAMVGAYCHHDGWRS